MHINRLQDAIPSASTGTAINGLVSSTSNGLAKADSFDATLRSLENKTNEGPKEPGKLGDKPIKPEGEELRQAFQDFVGQTLFSQMIASMRTTQGESAYFNGGRAEKIFQGQLDQMLSEELSDASASKISDPMFKLFQLRRQ